MWLLYAFISCCCYASFNYTTGLYNPNVLGGKVINSLMLGLAALGIQIYLTVKDKIKQSREVRTDNAPTDIG
jgi:hypothetical protein